MKTLVMAALVCCLVASWTSSFSRRRSEVTYNDRGLGKNQPFAAAGAYATVKNADTEGYVRTKAADTYDMCVDRLTKAGERDPAFQCRGDSWGYGYGGGVPYQPPFIPGNIPGSNGGGYLGGAGWPYGASPHRLILKNVTRSFYAAVRIDGQPINEIIPPQGEIWISIRFPPPSPTNPRSEGRFSVETTWFSDPYGREPVGITKTTPAFRPRDGGSLYACRR